MKLYLLMIILILLPAEASASWQSYQNDLRNTGSANETGYFPLQTSNFSDDSLGMSFQPLVDDLNADSKNEIVIFSNDSLIVFSPTLAILNQTQIGTLLGQPALFDFDDDGLIEIIFNSRQNSTDYFFAYQLNNSNLLQEFNITLPYDASLGGIKCLDLNGTNSCVFKDWRNHIHIVNMGSRNDAFYSTQYSTYNETVQTVPAIADIDSDGNYEAVFWFNGDHSFYHELLAFDLGTKKADWLSDVYASYGLNRVHKGQPVLVDLNNDGNLEIAVSVLYIDLIFRADWFTELFVFNSSGNKSFSRCTKNPSNNCNAQSNGLKMEGTNPFAIDFDKNGFDDICLVKDRKSNFDFEGMSLNCYNYSGDEIASVKLSIAADGIKGDVIAADMNNDGLKDIITFHDVYMQNGTILYGIGPVSSGTVAVPVDLDGNKGLDLIYTFGSRTQVFLDSSNYTVDLSVDDISFSRFNSSHVNVSAIVKNTGQIEVNGIKTIVYNTETLENKTAIISIKRTGNFTFSALLELGENQKVLVSADFDNEINESNEDNNIAFSEFIDLPHVFVSMDNFEPYPVQHEFRSYIKKKLSSGYYTENENEADIKVYIGKNNPVNLVNNIKTLDEFEFGYDFGNVMHNDKVGSNPYAALVGAFEGKIMIVGNEIEGDIIGVKEFINNQALLLNTKTFDSAFVDDEDIDAVKVYDYLHLGGNSEHYNLNNEQFKAIVRNALNDEMFSVFDRNVVSSNGITLRLRNLKPNASSDFLEYLNSTGVRVELPVVLAHGLFSNLTTWEVLGAELSNAGRDTWLIEITGGPFQDCDGCIDYTFYNLTDIFVPALLNGVLDFTGKDKIQYVGFSNGCRSALDSLERGMFDSSKVETFVAVGCPGAFEKLSLLDSGVLLVDDRIIENLQKKDIKHVNIGGMFKLGLFNRNTITDEESGKISLNLWKAYLSFMSLTNDTQPGKVTLTKFAIIQGNALGTSDGIVTTIDEDSIYSNIQLKNLSNIKSIKQSFKVLAFHSNLDTRTISKTLIRRLINNEELTFFERTFNLLNESKT